VAEGDWWRHGVVYQIYPRSFADADGDGIGDLRGIASRLDHLNDGTPGSLGVDAIWLSPFYPSPMADFGYDVADYCDVDPRFGTLDDFDALVRECHRRSIRVVVDFVPNHTSDRHPWFLASRSSRDDPKRDWYVWADPRPDGSPPTNWLSVFQTGPRPQPAWTLDPGTGQHYLHSFLPQQPDLNWLNHDVRAAMDGVVRFWLDRSVDGFRVDAVQRLGHDPALRDDPMTSDQRYPEDLPVAHDIIRGLRRVLDGYGDRMMVGEVYLLDAERMVGFYGANADEFHLVFNFSFLRQAWSAAGFREAVARFESLLPRDAWPDYTLSNHDHPRTVTRYGGDGLGAERARVAAMMLLTLRGTPFLYYGEEIGMVDASIPKERWLDPIGRDGCRTPMRWTADPLAGFTKGEPWLPVDDEEGQANVEAQAGDPASMLGLYRRLIWYRKRSAALRWGGFRGVDVEGDVFAYVRETQDERILVALNFSSDRPGRVELPGAREARRELSTHPELDVGTVRGSLELRPVEGVVLRLQR
jgi:alpha-glucosidase